MNITIGVPVTRTKYLLEAMESIACQTIPVQEVIVVDNGADGDIPILISGIKLPVRIIKRAKRLPPVENWNQLLAEVRTEWFILLSDDDFFEPDHIEQLQRLAVQNPNSRVLHTRVRLVNAEGHATALSPQAPSWESIWDFLWHRSLGYRVQFLSDFAWRTGALQQVGGFADMPSAWGSDDLTVVRVGIVGGLACGSRPTLNYRIHSQSISASYTAEDKLVAIDLLINEYGSLAKAAVLGGTCTDDTLLIKAFTGNLTSFRARMQRFVLGRTTFSARTKHWFLSVGKWVPYQISVKTLLRSYIDTIISYRKV